MAEDRAANNGGRGKWLKPVLILSLALNLLVVGIVGGAALGRHGRDGPGSARDVGFGPYTAALSDQDRTALRDAFLAAAPGFREMRQEMRQDMAALAATLRADPWDGAAAEAVLGSQGQRMADRLALGRRLLLERIAAMTPEERAALADRIEDVGDRPWRARSKAH